MNRTYIKEQTYSSTYKKGTDIYYEQGVWDFRVEEEEMYDFIEAVVRGSGHNCYQVTMEIDRKADELAYCECECPAMREYMGICKHCTAVLLEYVDFQKRRSLKENKSLRLEQIHGIQKGIRLSTTPELKELLKRQSVERSFPIACRKTYEKVRLEPIFTYNKREMYAEFRIGIDRMYVLKDVFAFAKHLENCETYSYGKKLEFVHSLEAFEPKSRGLAEFIKNWAEEHSQDYSGFSNSYYGYRYGLPELRYLPLDKADVERFFKAVGEREFLADIGETGERLWQTTEERLEHKLSVTGEHRGIRLLLETDMHCETEDNIFYFKEGKIYKKSKQELKAVLPFMECASKQAGRMLYVEKEDVPLFCRELLPELKKEFNCEYADFKEEDYSLPKPDFRIYLDAPKTGWVSCKVIAVYEGEEYSVYDQHRDLDKREIGIESEVAGLVSSYCNAFDEKEQVMVLAEEEELLYRLLTEGIVRMQEIAEVFVSEAIKKIRLVEPSRTAVGVSVSEGLLELQITSDEMNREELFEILSKYNKKKKFYRLKSGDMVYVKEEQAEQMEALRELKEGLRLTERQWKQEVVSVPRYRALYLDKELRGAQGVQYSCDKAFEKLLRGIDSSKKTAMPKELAKILRPYQKQGVCWIKQLKENGFGGILADDMGLGKTLQVITFLKLEQKDGRKGKTLIITPASLIFNWKSEIKRFAPELSVRVVAGTQEERCQFLTQAREGEILVTSYDLLKRDIEQYEKISFSNEIIDEAQYIKNHKTQAARAVKEIRSEFRLALTGTPVENRLSELWSIFDYLMPGFLYEYSRFREDIEIPVVQNQEERLLARLRAMVTPFILRRLKKDVLKELPEKLEENRYVKLVGEQQKLYDAHVKRLQLLLEEKSEEDFEKSKLWILSELTKLRQICCEPSLAFEGYKGESAKLEMCMDTIRNAIEGGHKILLFSQFTSMLEQIEKRLKKEKITFYTLTGATGKEKRAKMVEAFNGDDTQVFCISLKAGGTGLNLTSADIVIHYDPWWNIAVQNQATDRAHRIGQQKVVVVYKLIASGTIEENILKIQEKKKELAEQILNGEGVSSAKLSKEDLQELLNNA